MRGRWCRLAAVVAAMVAAVTPLTACTNGGMVGARGLVGPRSGAITVLIDTPALSAARCAMEPYVRGQVSGIRFGGATPTEIATAVKYGQRVDVVILPPGPALDRVRDELAAPPARIVVAPTRTYWVGAVTGKGLPFTTFLSSGPGRAMLTSGGCAGTRTPR